MDGIISLPIALIGFFILPDVPEISNPWYLSKQEVALSQKRMELEGREKRQPYTKAKIMKIITSWHIYLLTVLFAYIFLSWAHEICADDNEERAITVGTMNEVAYIFQIWMPQVVWQQVDAPQYQKGYISLTMMSAIHIATAFMLRFQHNREIKK
ncbi:hypothetical protein Egran_01806 [Elaphomyces granulatus]|uniref:Uncharacterized protein n=1 Tax=Elaphomyces granulatus TaxID=519963 RepID=A0A232M1Y3_9EURO|nr:hypothetical protein Egran_01806 [Elaphomyces granulatus]